MRDELEGQLDQLLTHVVGMAERTDAMMGAALTALNEANGASATLVFETDQLVDRAYHDVQNGVLTAIALHGPVGRDLRMLTALIHVSLHIERMGDYAKNVARAATSTPRDGSEPAVLDQLAEMGELARGVGRDGVRSFVVRDVDLAADVLRRDDAVDRLNLAVFHRLVRLAADDDAPVEWAARMIQVTRQLERYADHGVDIAGMTAFVGSHDRSAGAPGDSTA